MVSQQSASCTDKSHLCPVWAGHGSCDTPSSRDYMMQSCKKSCNACPGSAGAVDKMCRDMHQYCHAWANAGMRYWSCYTLYNERTTANQIYFCSMAGVIDTLLYISITIQVLTFLPLPQSFICYHTNRIYSQAVCTLSMRYIIVVQAHHCMITKISYHTFTCRSM